MKKVYDNLQPLTLIGHFKSLLEEAGIPVHIKNDNSHVAMGEVPQIEISPEIWVINDEDYDRAKAIIDDFRSQPAADAPPWQCPQCGETVESTFAECWKCGAPHPDTTNPT
ncbi:MAG: DUF2007 domain-containing protein [Verrucomicrobiota bacterium]